MGFITLILLAFGLSADAFAVAVSDGICSHKVTRKDAFYTALTFGFFQGLMPVLGFTLGNTFSEVVDRYQHWIALLLLGAIGINMISEAYKEYKHPEEACAVNNIFRAKNLILQGIATSIDAMAAGVSLAVMDFNIFYAAILIGIITFICCFLGVEIGKRFGSMLGLSARFIGGSIIILIGLKIFIENQLFR